MRLYPIFSNNLKTNFQPRPLTDGEFDDFTKLLLEKSPLTYKEAEAINMGKNQNDNYLQFRIDRD